MLFLFDTHLFITFVTFIVSDNFSKPESDPSNYLHTGTSPVRTCSRRRRTLRRHCPSLWACCHWDRGTCSCPSGQRECLSLSLLSLSLSLYLSISHTHTHSLSFFLSLFSLDRFFAVCTRHCTDSSRQDRWSLTLKFLSSPFVGWIETHAPGDISTATVFCREV